ncbi:MAG: FtsW/RodA/SpoVE family cell cycle protein [Clostridiales bacterium]|nr:FtsW/RodA/SpoVE family cell cycle protein [Clostridiales bacterium]
MKILNDFVKNIDKLLLSLCLLASALGVLMVYSASLSSKSQDQVLSRDVIIMLAAVGLGLVLCFIISALDYEAVLKLWPFFTAICLALMFALFIWGVGPGDRPDAKSWLSIGGIHFQPSELLKIGFILTFSLHIDAVKGKTNDLKNIALLALHGIFPALLVIVTGDLGSALVFVGMFLGMMFLAGVKFKFFLIGGAFALAGLPVLWLKFFSQFQKDRFLAIYYPQGLSESTYKTIIYQQQQSVNAIGAGRLTGSGLFKGVFTQNNLIPVDESDMIFAVIGEELGFIGAVLFLLLLAFIVVKILSIAHKANTYSGKLISYGMALMLGVQTIINIGVSLKLLPCIGITLPFYSAGGSANICVYIGIGILLSIYRSSVITKPVNFRLSHISTPFSEA